MQNIDFNENKEEITYSDVEGLSYISTYVYMNSQNYILVLGPFIIDDGKDNISLDELNGLCKFKKDDVKNISYFLHSQNWKIIIKNEVSVNIVEVDNFEVYDRYNLMYTNYDTINSNDKYENHILDLVISGYYKSLKSFMRKNKFDSVEHYDLDDKIRTLKNLTLSFNSLCCRASIKGGISPVYARSFCATIGKKIENLNCLESIEMINKEIPLIYCKKVQEFKLDGYSELLKKCVHYINDNISEEITLYDLSEYCNVSYEYLSRHLKKQSGFNFLTILQKIRVENAKRLIKNGFSITEITQLIGLKSISQFCHIFKKHTGVTATEWKSNNMK